ncbi:MAG TPA: EamA family transporter [Propionibacteriaceae bacterium]
MSTGSRPRLARPSAVWLVLGSITTVQVGAAIAKHLFGLATPTGIVWLRLATAAVILLLWSRPRLRGRTRNDWLLVTGYAVALAGMNWSIYQAFSRIPVGLAVTLEFLGPLTVALVTSRGVREIVWALLATAGVALLGFSPTSLSWAGIGFALLAGTGWAAYIVISPHLGRRWDGIGGLAVAHGFGAIAFALPAILLNGIALANPTVLGLGLLVGLLSSVIPYSLELQALRTLPTRVFSILMSLEPAFAAMAAFIILGERLSLVDLMAMACVVAASVGITRSVQT